ncbi:TetR/AcrR family transcriptional regulator [Vibrio profundum]|uniref:TetR/AcrR family transcriptional regulator n=1 Tax=Vibrio profundum TaxID=2910247 RepID=UPI003D122D57
MPRTKSYDRNTVIDKAIDLFQRHGFAVASSQMLVETLGISRFSLYAEFESKQKLFKIALDRYNQTNVERNFSPLETPEAGLGEIRSLFRFFAQAIDGHAAGLGCLLCNTAVEFGPSDPSGEEFINKYFARITNAFYNALGNAERHGKLQGVVSLKEEADFLTTSILGLFVMLRANAPAQIVKSAVTAGIRHVDNLARSS